MGHELRTISLVNNSIGQKVLISLYLTKHHAYKNVLAEWPFISTHS